MKPKSQPDTYWVECGPGRLTNIDWSKWLGRDDKPIDPYLVWADISGRHTGEALSFIIELTRDGLPYRQRIGQTISVPWIFGIIDVPAIYRVVTDPKSPEGMQGIEQKIDRRYITAQLDPRDVIHLLCSSDVSRAQLGIPRLFAPRDQPREVSLGDAEGEIGRVVVGVIDDGFGFAHERFRDHLGRPRVQYLWDQDRRRERSALPGSIWEKPEELGYGAELGPVALRDLVLNGCDDPWAPYAMSGYGRFRLDPEAYSTAPIDAAERALPVASMVMATHGHTVLDLAAGFPPVHRGQQEPLADRFLCKPRDFQTARQAVQHSLVYSTNDDERRAGIDTADQWHLVLVQLPVGTVADTTGGSLAVQVLDGIRYILDRAKRVPHIDSKPSDGTAQYVLNPVIVNISYGAIGGGHEGTSIAEKAIKELTEKEARLWVVLAAGNAHRSRTHASALLRKGQTVSFFWTIGPDNPLESFLEVWLPERDAQCVEVPTDYVGQVDVHVTAPDGRVLLRGCVGQALQLRDTETRQTNPPAAALVFARKVVQSEHGTMILLAVAPTRDAEGSATTVPHGEWILTLGWGAEGDSASSAVLPIHAWSERSDLLFGVGRPQQSRVVTGEEPDGEVSQFDPDVLATLAGPPRGVFNLQPPYGLRGSSSFSSLGSMNVARSDFALRDSGTSLGATVVVGGYRISDDEVSRDSSGGPSRGASIAEAWQALQSAEASVGVARRRPDVNGPSDLSLSVAGLRASGLHSSHWVRASGSSVAAAQVTRAIANVQFLESKPLDLPNGTSTAARKVEALLLQPSEPSVGRRAEGARATLTPRLDDAFRAAAKRAR